MELKDNLKLFSIKAKLKNILGIIRGFFFTTYAVKGTFTGMYHKSV